MIFKQLRTQYKSDGRVVKAQLDFVADVVESSRFVNPLWTAMFAWIGSDALGMFGHAPLLRAMMFPFVVTAAIFASLHFIERYRRETGGTASYECVRPWFSRFIALQIMASVSWGLAPWLLWDPGNLVNHLFIAAMTLGVLAASMITRANHIDLFLASLLPQAGLAILRFALAGTAPDLIMACLLAGAVAQFWIDGRRLTNCVGDNAYARFKVEDLALELKRTRDEALRKRFEAETANASKTTFLANMSHELRTPLNAILGFSEIIEQECFGPAGSPRYKEYAGDIHSSGAHLLSLINDLLDVAKIEAGKMEIEPSSLDVKQSFESALKLMAAKTREKDQELRIDVDANMPPLFADERALKQILINLVSNAVKFTPEGGRITVTGRIMSGGEFQLLVEDNGPGLPDELLDRIFMPFSQVDNRYDRQAGGSGLGLALVRGLAELHGGRAWLESEPGKGCRAYVALPMVVHRHQAELASAAA